MAKPAKPKRVATKNPRSRESKRATSPSINVDKSIKQTPRASDATPVLATRPDSGISKSKKRQKPLTKGQRQRQERVLARAEVVQDQMKKKVQNVDRQTKTRRERKGMWEEVNGSANRFDKLKGLPGGEADAAEKDEWEDMEEVEDNSFPLNGSDNLPNVTDAKLVVVDRTAAAPEPTTAEDEDDQIT